MVSPGKRVCDVGCDHGYVSIYLIESGRADAVLAMDVNRGPLERARINVEKHGLTGYITLRLSNGLDAYRTGEAQSLVIAGMGGRLMQSILTKDKEKTEDFEELILKYSDSEEGTCSFGKGEKDQTFEDAAFNLETDEISDIVETPEGYYLIKCQAEGCVSAGDGSQQQSGLPDGITKELADAFGSCLLAKRDPVLYEYIFRQKEDILRLIHAMGGQEESER